MSLDLDTSPFVYVSAPEIHLHIAAAATPLDRRDSSTDVHSLTKTKVLYHTSSSFFDRRECAS